jgi:PPOX class probable F420-dependent enzyme
MSRTMTEDEWRRFVMEGTRTGKLATVRADGSATVVPVWFVLDDDGTFVFMTGAGSAKGKAMRRDPRVALLVDDERPPFADVLARGEVTLDDDVDAMLPWSIEIGGRYMGQDRAQEFGRRNAVPGELLVRLTPRSVITEADVAD